MGIMGKKIKSTFSSLWIRLLTTGAALDVLLRALFLVYTQRMTREKADHLTRKFGKNLLDIVQVKRHFFFETPIEFEPNRCYMIMSNHNSLYDIPLMFEAFQASVRMLAKKELYKIPLFGLTLKTNEFLCIDRQNKIQAIADLEKAKEKMKSGIILWVAPEGTRSSTGELLPFKKGVFHLALDTKATIIPVGINSTHRVLPAKTWNFSPNEIVNVHVGEPIDTSNYTEKERHILMELVRSNISELVKKGTPTE